MAHAARLAGGALLAALILSALLVALPLSEPTHPSAASVRALGDVVAFEPNAGRGPRSVDFYARLGGAGISIARGGTRFSVNGVTSRLVGAAPRNATAERQLRMRVNDYAGADPSTWRTGIPTFGRVRYGSVYPGIDLVYHGRGSRLEYDFVVKAGADPRRIALDIGGVSAPRVGPNGDLVAGKLRHRRPVAYQYVDGRRRTVEASFALDGTSVRFRLGRYDRSRAVVIDPVLTYSDFIASVFADAYDVAVDSSGNAYVSGQTYGTGAVPPGPSTSATGYVLKIGPGGSRAWVTYLASTSPYKLALDSSGSPYITGDARDGLPVKNADQGTYGGGVNDAFAGRLNAADGTTDWLTYFGGTGSEAAGPHSMGIAVDAAGNAYLGTSTNSTGLATGAVFDTAPSGYDGIVTKYSSAGARLLTTYIGGSGSDDVDAIGVDANCSSNCAVWVGGATTSNTDFPVLGNDNDHGQLNFGGGTLDAFAMKLKPDLSGRDFASFYGGANNDRAQGLVVDHGGNATIVGFTHQATDDAFVHMFFPDGRNLFDKKLAGNGDDTAYDVAADSSLNVYVIGTTASTDFPTTGQIQKDPGGTGDAFIARVNENFAASNPVLLSTYLGGGNSEQGYGIGLGPSGDVWAVGQTISNDFPAVANTQPVAAGGWVVTISIAPVLIDSGPDGVLRSHDASFTYSVDEPGASFGCRLTPAETSFTSCPPAGKTYTGLADGSYSFEIRATDLGGRTGRSTTRAFSIDTRPIASLKVAPSPALVGRTVTFDASESSGATGVALTKFEWDLDGDGTFERETGSASTTTDVYNAPRDNTATVRVTDAAGAVATATAQLKVNAAPPLGSQFGVTINNGAQFTRTPNVTVTANFPASTTSMLFSNDGGFLAPSVFPPAKTVKWKLDSSGPERLPKQIYVRFLAGTIPSETFQDDIILDETPPTVQQAVVAPAAGAAQASARAAAAKRKWKVRVKAKDSNSGVSRIQVTASKKKPGKLLRYKRRLTVKSPQRPKWVRARDRAGNYSRWRRAR